jgi:hypothetical protein
MTSDQELLLEALDGRLPPEVDARLAARLAAEPDLARELLRLARQEALLHDVAAVAPAATSSTPVPPTTSIWSRIAMAASLIAFCTVLYAIFIPAPIATPARQDPSLIDKLRSNDLAERDAALVELKKTPIEKLDSLEKALDSDDAEVAGKVREAMAHVLKTALSRKLDNYELRATADAKTLKQWIKDGGTVVPDGYEVLELPSDPNMASGKTLGRDILLVRSKPVLSAKHVKTESVKVKEGANNAPAMTSAGGAQLQLELTDDGSKLFDEGANGTVFAGVLIAGGRAAQRLSIVKVKDGGFQTWARGKEAAESLVALLKGEKIVFGFRLAPDRADAVSAEEATKAAKAVVADASFTPADKAIDAVLPLDAKAPDFVALWKAARKIGWRLSK